MQLEGEEGSQVDEDEVRDSVAANGSEVVEMAGSSVPAPRASAVRKRAWWPVALTRTMRQARDMLPQSVNEVMR